MNTTRTHSLAAISAATLLTVAMLLSINALAVVDHAPAQMAAQGVSSQA